MFKKWTIIQILQIKIDGKKSIKEKIDRKRKWFMDINQVFFRHIFLIYNKKIMFRFNGVNMFMWLGDIENSKVITLAWGWRRNGGSR